MPEDPTNKSFEVSSAELSPESEKEKQLEALTKIAQEHPEVLENEATPKMLAAFAKHLKTPSGDVYVTYTKIVAGASWAPGKLLHLWMDKPKFTTEGELETPEDNAMMTSRVYGKKGYGGIEVVPDDTESALAELSRNMELVATEDLPEIGIGYWMGKREKDPRISMDKMQNFLY